MRTNLIIATLLLLPALAHADSVFLINGGVLEGRVSYEDGRVVVEQATGKVYLDKSKIDHIEKSKTDLDGYDERLALVRAKGDQATADDWASLGQYATDHGMRERGENNFRKAIAIDSNNSAARLALGYVKFQDRWMTPDDANVARGMVKHNGVWITQEAQTDLLKAEGLAKVAKANADAEDAKAEVERLKLERLDKELQAIQSEREYGPRYNNPYIQNPLPLPTGPGTPGVPSTPASAPSKASAPLPVTSIGPMESDTPDTTVRLGPGGSLIVTPKK